MAQKPQIVTHGAGSARMNQSMLLDLHTMERPVIAIDGKVYEMLVPDDFGLSEMAKLRRMQCVVASVQVKTEADLTDEDLVQLGEAMTSMTRLIMPGVPADVLARLRDGQKLKIIETFTTLAGGTGNLLPAKSLPA